MRGGACQYDSSHGPGKPRPDLDGTYCLKCARRMRQQSLDRGWCPNGEPSVRPEPVTGGVCSICRMPSDGLKMHDDDAHREYRAAWHRRMRPARKVSPVAALRAEVARLQAEVKRLSKERELVTA